MGGKIYSLKLGHERNLPDQDCDHIMQLAMDSAAELELADITGAVAKVCYPDLTLPMGEMQIHVCALLKLFHDNPPMFTSGLQVHLGSDTMLEMHRLKGLGVSPSFWMAPYEDNKASGRRDLPNKDLTSVKLRTRSTTQPGRSQGAYTMGVKFGHSLTMGSGQPCGTKGCQLQNTSLHSY